MGGTSFSCPELRHTGSLRESALLFALQLAHRHLGFSRSAVGTWRAPLVRHPFSDQLYADDLVVVADCEHDLQMSCDVVAAWTREWRFNFDFRPTKSAAMVFGPARLVTISSVTRHSHVFLHLGSPHSQTDFAQQSPLRSARVLVSLRPSASCFRVKFLPHLRLADCVVGCTVLFWVSPRCTASRWKQCDVGAAVLWGCLAGRPLQFTWNLAGLTRSGSSQVSCCPSSGASLPCASEIQPLCLADGLVS